MLSRPLPARAAVLAAVLILPLLPCACSRNAPALNPPSAATGTVLVRVTFREAPLPGARVEFRSSPDGPGSAVGPAETDREGVAAVDVPPGRYFLVVQWRRDGDYRRPIAAGDRYAWFGGNPVYPDRAGRKEFIVGLEEFASPPGGVGEPAGGTGIAGRVTAGGSPAENVFVYAYLRTESAFRDLGFSASAPTASDGSFVMDLPPGRYYLLARRRTGGGVAGPMRKGDLFGYYPANPVTVGPGAYTRVTIPATLLKLRNAPSYSGGYRAAASIEGRIVGPDGKPRAGVYAALYDNPDLLNRPVFLSDVTGEDGRFHIPVPVPGTYYLGARSGYGGSPAPGDLYGRYEGNPDHVVTVRDGDRLAGFDIAVGEVR
jgi:hypothetical protein